MEALVKCEGCIKHEWRETPPLPIHKFSVDGKRYCLFHAPRDKKLDANGNPVSVAEFNQRFFAKVKECHARGQEPLCILPGIIFPGDIDFSKAFPGNELKPLNIQHSVFSGKALFRGLTIRSLLLSNSTFQENADFSGARFISAPDFHTVKFNGKAHFSDTTFESGAMFIASEFEAPVWFFKSVFGGNVLFHATRADDNIIRMQRLTTKDLSNVIYSSSEVKSFSFCECEPWPDRFGYEQDEKISDLQLEELYRAMKQKAAESHDQPQVSRWHFREKLMELKQLFDNDRSNKLIEVVEDRDAKWRDRAKAWFKLLWHRPHWPKLTLTGIYWATSGFGERAVRAGVWLLALVALSFFANAWTPSWNWNAVLPLASAANATMATIPFAKDIPGEGWLKVGRGFWQFLIAVQFTLFALAVRNRFRR
ncbi:MAG: pentapeptide repeat-containing protein [Humidesulfovibrio sp.]|uniref:pentapeptide repeat-containing protein n=1 Tax=Humidesulfovibrio sp. TaxID=2910988 RepID=UPI0027356CAD|nr:pentapeptide repeat-containing protein [Humidesulfovibrio sp.]MDP2849173.1 pentapeptide repeat-containing protein [Humidesulfovibrio sp.]